MKLFQIVIEFAQIPQAWKTPLSSEAFGPFHIEALNQEQALKEFRNGVRAYNGRCQVCIEPDEYIQAMHVVSREVEPFPTRLLNKGYREWHCLDRGIVDGKLDVKDD